MHDPKLPALDLAVDDQAMGPALAAVLPGVVDRLRHRVLKYKPGKHCVIEYQLETEGAVPSARTVIGKLYRDERGLARYRELLALRDSARRAGCELGLPDPLAHLPGLGMVLVAPAPGAPLSAALDPAPADLAALTTTIEGVAHRLSLLHGLAVPAATERRMAGHLTKYCQPGPAALGAACDELAPLLDRIVDRLGNDPQLEGATLVPVHGDLGLSQVFVAGPRISFIDLDGFCRSHPALDLGNFLVSLRSYLGPRSDEVERRFLARYLATRPRTALQGLASYQALAWLRRAMSSFRLRPSPDWRDEVRRHLDRAAASLDGPCSVEQGRTPLS